MPIEILMPALSPTMTEGTLAAWSVKEGDIVSSGDVIAEIETDKATMEVEAVDEGTIGKLVVAAGTEGVPVNQVIAILLVEGEESVDLTALATKAPPEQTSETPESIAKESQKTESPAAKQTKQVTKAIQSEDRIFASPLAKRLAEQAGYALADIQGTGPRGRVVKRDVEAHQPSVATKDNRKTRKVAASGPSPKELADLLGTTYREEPVSKMRGVIAERLMEAKQTIPHFYLTIECELDALLSMRKQINEPGDVKISVNDLIIKAVAKALIKVPEANASWNGDTILYYDQADVAVAVAIEGGLVTPIVRGAESKPLTAISDEMKDLAGRAKDGKLKPDEYQGGSFSISNLGMFGIKEFSAVINPPHGAILAIGMGEKRPVVKNDELTIATMMSCTLSCDHRVVDGAVGATFLQAFKGMIENPLGMLI